MKTVHKANYLLEGAHEDTELERMQIAILQKALNLAEELVDHKTDFKLRTLIKLIGDFKKSEESEHDGDDEGSEEAEDIALARRAISLADHLLNHDDNKFPSEIASIIQKLIENEKKELTKKGA